jgi:glutaredoxin
MENFNFFIFILIFLKHKVTFAYLNESYGKLKRSTSVNDFEKELSKKEVVQKFKDDLQVRKGMNFQKLYQQNKDEDDFLTLSQRRFRDFSRLKNSYSHIYQKKIRSFWYSRFERERKLFHDKPKQNILIKTYTGNYPMSPLSDGPFWDVLYEKIEEVLTQPTYDQVVFLTDDEIDTSSTEDEDENEKIRKRILINNQEKGTTDSSKREEMFKKSNGAKTIPQIFIGEQHVGGNTELQALERDGKLDSLLSA